MHADIPLSAELPCLRTKSMVFLTIIICLRCAHAYTYTHTHTQPTLLWLWYWKHISEKTIFQIRVFLFYFFCFLIPQNCLQDVICYFFLYNFVQQEPLYFIPGHHLLEILTFLSWYQRADWITPHLRTALWLFIVLYTIYVQSSTMHWISPTAIFYTHFFPPIIKQVYIFQCIDAALYHPTFCTLCYAPLTS